MENATDQKPSPEGIVLKEGIRIVRHEVGDLLQTIYSAASLLQKRLPADWEQERQIVANLRVRAESCKYLLDSIRDCLCPPVLACSPVNLAELADKLAAIASVEHPHLEVRSETKHTIRVVADPHGLAQVGSLVLANACENAQKEVVFRTSEALETGEVEWTFTADGPGLPSGQLSGLLETFTCVRNGRLALGLAPARNWVLLHGGRITAENLPAGGWMVKVVLPRQPPSQDR